MKQMSLRNNYLINVSNIKCYITKFVTGHLNNSIPPVGNVPGPPIIQGAALPSTPHILDMNKNSQAPQLPQTPVLQHSFKPKVSISFYIM